MSEKIVEIMYFLPFLFMSLATLIIIIVIIHFDEKRREGI